MTTSDDEPIKFMIKYGVSRKNNELIMICNKSENSMEGNNENKVCDNYGKHSSESQESESESEHSL